MRHLSAAQLAAAFVSFLCLGVWAGCSGTPSTTTPAVVKIVMSPSSVSLNIGQVVKITGIPQNSTGGAVVADVSYSSSNPSQISISPSGYICGGVWDPNFITCTALPGKTGVGQATITATSGTITATAPAYTHLQADQVSVNPPTGCVSVGATPTYYATAYNTTAPGCSVAIPCDITSTVGPISFYSTDFTVMSNNSTTGVLTATEPGSTSIYASVSGLNSVPAPAQVCRVVSIQVHDAASSNTTFNLAPTNTQNLVADVIDSNGVSILPSITWNSVPAGVASVTLGTDTTTNSAIVTANTGGTTTITATCSTPNCNRNINPQYQQNTVTVNVSGTTTTTVYAASTKSLTMIPITTSNNTAGTAIALPYLPNSISSDSAGTKVFLGSATGIMVVNVLTANVSVSAAALGQIIATSPDGLYLLVSDSVSGNVYLFATANSTVVLTQSLTASSGAFTPDGHSVSFLGPGNQLYYYTILPTSNVATLSYVPNALDVSSQGGMTYITSSTLGAIDVRATCNQSDWQTLAATAPTLVAHLPGGNGAVVADSPAIDVVTTGAIPTDCPPTPQSTVNTYNLGLGNFTANQMFVSPDSSRAWILSNLPQVIGLNLSSLTPFSISLANGAQPLSGGIMIDGSFVYVGGSDGNVHAINVSSGNDSAQIAPGLKDTSGNAVNPDLVLVLPK
jgi:trimeric autotransporter adhesin